MSYIYTLPMALSGPVRQAPLVHQVSEQFRGLIEAGTWPVGTKIPGENQLAGELGVSRGTVREALRSLSLTGLLEPRVGDGTYVRATNEISGVLVRDELSATLEHVLDARAGLEGAAARLAADNHTQRGLAAMEVALEARSTAHEAGDLDGYVTADMAFHRGVVEASGNPLLLRLYDAVAEVLTESIHDTATIPEDPRIRDAHYSLVAAIREGDPETAAQASYALIDSVKRSVSE